MTGAPMEVYSVWPQLLLLQNGALVLSSGRPGLGFWVSPHGDGTLWTGYDVCKEHTKLAPADPFGAALSIRA
jgi:hypothetical protein